MRIGTAGYTATAWRDGEAPPFSWTGEPSQLVETPDGHALPDHTEVEVVAPFYAGWIDTRGVPRVMHCDPTGVRELVVCDWRAGDETRARLERNRLAARICAETVGDGRAVTRAQRVRTARELAKLGPTGPWSVDVDEVRRWLDDVVSSTSEALPRPGRDPFVPTHVVAERAANGEVLRRYPVMAIGGDMAYAEEVWCADGRTGLNGADTIALRNGGDSQPSEDAFVVAACPSRYVGVVGADDVRRVYYASASGVEPVEPDGTALNWTDANGRRALAAEFISDLAGVRLSAVDDAVQCTAAETRVSWIAADVRTSAVDGVLARRHASIAWEIPTDELRRWLRELVPAPPGVYLSPVVDRAESRAGQEVAVQLDAAARHLEIAL